MGHVVSQLCTPLILWLPSVGRHAARIAVESDFVAFYFGTHNTRVYRELPEPQRIDFALESAPALEAVLSAYPKYITVARLPGENDAQRLDVAKALVEARAVLVRQPADSSTADNELDRKLEPSTNDSKLLSLTRAYDDQC